MIHGEFMEFEGLVETVRLPYAAMLCPVCTAIMRYYGREEFRCVKDTVQLDVWSCPEGHEAYS